MPIFEYKCEQCGYRFDRLVMRHDSPVNCPLCQSRVKKLMSVFAVGAHTAGESSLCSSPGCSKICTNC